MCELYAVITELISVCEAGGSRSEELKKWKGHLQSCDSWMVVNKNPDRKKNFCKISKNASGQLLLHSALGQIVFLHFLGKVLIAHIFGAETWRFQSF